MKIRIGDKIKIRGDVRDATDHMDGETLVVIATPDAPGDYDIHDDTVVGVDKYGYQWYIYISNILEVLDGQSHT